MIRKKGKKGLAWERDKKRLVKEAVACGRLTIDNGYPEGNCSDCGHHHPLNPDHRKKRSAGGSNDQSNIDWVCDIPPCWCHSKRDRLGDPMNKKNKQKKPKWMKDHKCKNCKQITSILICEHCKKISV